MTAPATACDEFRPYMPGSVTCDSCGHWKSAHRTAPAVDSDGDTIKWSELYNPAPAVDSDDGPEPSGAPVPPQGAPLQNASPVDPPVPHEPTGLATELVWLPDTSGWDRAIELSAHVARLSALLGLIMADLDDARALPPHMAEMARDALAKAREATREATA